MNPRLPQTFDKMTTLRLHGSFLLALAPIVAFSVAWQGVRPLILTLLSMGAAWLSEELLRRLTKTQAPRDLSAPLWGLLLALLLPANAPFYLPVVGSVFAVLVVKGLLAGSGTPWINPVLAAWALIQTTWPGTFAAGPFSVSSHQTALGGQATDWLNTNLFSWFSIQLPSGYVDLFLGSGRPESALLVESGTAVLLASTVYLLAKGYFPWQIPAAFFAAFSLPTALLGGDVLLQVFSGGFLLNMFILASDPSSRPLSRRGLVVYGLGAGALTCLVRTWGLSSDGVGYAVLFMSLVVPWLDARLRRKVLNDFRLA